MVRIIVFMGILHFALIGIVHHAFAQFDEYERGQQLKNLDLGIRHFENGDYEAADESFRQVLEAVKVLPAEICYYFGVNSYYLNKYKQSINWLNKYIELKGTSGQFFEECTTYLKLSEQKYLQANNTQKDDSFEPEHTVDYTVMPEVDCGPSGKVMCPVCKGQTVIISRSAMSLTYRTCQYCDKHGNLTCENYNLLLQGKLRPNSERTAQ